MFTTASALARDTPGTAAIMSTLTSVRARFSLSEVGDFLGLYGPRLLFTMHLDVTGPFASAPLCALDVLSGAERMLPHSEQTSQTEWREGGSCEHTDMA